MLKITKENILVYIGFSLWMASLVILITTNQLELSARSELFAEFPLLLLLPYIAFVAPILEEFLFRLLLVKSEKNATKWFSLGFYLIIPLIYSKWYLYFFSVTIIAVKFSSREVLSDKVRTFILIFLSSSCFSLAHIVVFNFAAIFEFTLFLGCGFILGYIASERGLKHSIKVHLLYNLVLTLPLCLVLFQSLTSESVILENDVVKGELTYVSHEIQLGGNGAYLGDSIIIRNRPLQDIVFNLIDCKNCLKVKKGNPYQKVDMKIYSQKEREDSEIFPKNVLDLLLRKKLVSIDSIQEINRLHYVITKTIDCNCEKKKYRRSKDVSVRYVGINGLIEYIYKKYDKLIVVDIGYKNKCNMYLLNSSLSNMNFEAFLKHLKAEYCIELKESTANFSRYLIR